MTFDASTQTADLEIGQSGPHRPVVGTWLTTEVALLRALYPHGGASAVREALPHRSLCAIRAKGSALRIECHRPSTLGATFERKYPQRDDIDMAIRDCYGGAMQKGDGKRLVARIGRPAWWVHKRAVQLGVARNNRTRPGAWSADELEILQRWAMANLKVICRKLRDAGFNRTPTAVAIQLKRRKIDREDPDAWSATSIAPMFGVNPKTIADWVERRGLPAKRIAWGPSGLLEIRPTALRVWIKANPQWVDLRRVDQLWFWQLMFGWEAKE